MKTWNHIIQCFPEEIVIFQEYILIKHCRACCVVLVFWFYITVATVGHHYFNFLLSVFVSLISVTYFCIHTAFTSLFVQVSNMYSAELLWLC